MLFLKFKQSRAYTLIETLIVISLIGLFSAMGFVSYRIFMSSITADREIMRLYRTLVFARVEAVRYDIDVSVCPINSSHAGCGSDWSKGWLVFIDRMKDGMVHADSRILQVVSLPLIGSTITWRNFRSKNYVQFTSMGFTNYLNGTFLYYAKNRDPALMRRLVVDKNGAIRFSAGNSYTARKQVLR